MPTLVVVPTYCEVDNVEDLLRRLRTAAPHADVLVVDDSSPDGTAARVEQLAGDLGRVFLLTRPVKDGLGNAYRAGFAWGIEHGYDVLVEMDADLSHEPEAVPRLLAEIEAGADLVIGSRYVDGGTLPPWSWYRRALSSFGNRYAAFIMRLPVRDSTSGFRAYRRSALEACDYRSTRSCHYTFQLELVYRVVRAGCNVVEVPINFRDRTRGTSKMPLATVFESLAFVTLWGVRDRLVPSRRRTRKGAPVH